MVEQILINLLGVLIFMFVFWKKLEEDYTSNQIFSVEFIVVFSVFIVTLASRLYFPQWWFWMGFVGLLAGFILAILRYGLRFYESLEALIIGFLPLYGLIFLLDSIKKTSLMSILAFSVILAVIALYLYLNAKYKDFAWYKSGRVGFAGLMTLGVFFLIRGTVAIIFPTVLSFVGKYDPLISGIFSFTFFLMTLNLSRQGL